MSDELAHNELNRSHIVKNLVMTISCVTTLALAWTTLSMLSRPPLIIERGERGLAAINSMSVREPTEDEIKAFLREALKQRFESAKPLSLNYVSAREAQIKKSELAAFAKESIDRRIIIRGFTMNKDSIGVDVDRILAHERIRAAFPTKVSVKVLKIERTKDNPYGLILAETIVKIEEEAADVKK